MIAAIKNLFKRKEEPSQKQVDQLVQNTYRFEKWEDAIPYLGKPVKVCRVEAPDVTGYLTGVSVVIVESKITKGFLEINGHRWEHWRCRPDFYAIANPRSFRVFG